MRALLLLMIAFATTSVVSAQNKVVVAAEKMNVVYRGIPNPIAVSVPGAECNEVFIQVDNGKVSGEGCSYEIIPGQSHSMNVTAFVLSGIDTSLAGTYQFRVKRVPNPVASIAGIYGYGTDGNNYTSTNRILASPIIDSKPSGFDFEVFFYTQSFRLVINRTSGETIELSTKGKKLSEEMKSEIQQLTNGDQLTFTDIIVKGDDGEIRNLKDINIEIKQL